MADLSDVVGVLAQQAASAVYPNGTSSPSVAAVDCKIVSGWPDANDLDAYLAAGKIQVSVYPLPGMDRNTTRYPKQWQQLSVNAATLTLTVSSDTVTVGGTVSSPQNAALIVNGKSYVHAVQSGDTLTTIATALAALVSVDTPATSSGAVVTIPAAYSITARVGVTGTSIKETRRQQRVFTVIVWAPSPTLRDFASKAIDAVFSDIERLTMPDGTSARLIYRGTVESDANLPRKLYRRDLHYEVEYATTLTQTDYTVVTTQTNISNQPTGATAPVSTFQINL